MGPLFVAIVYAFVINVSRNEFGELFGGRGQSKLKQVVDMRLAKPPLAHRVDSPGVAGYPPAAEAPALCVLGAWKVEIDSGGNAGADLGHRIDDRDAGGKLAPEKEMRDSSPTAERI